MTVARGAADVGTVAGARDAARWWLRTHGVDDDASERTVLVVSELVTNAVRHGRSAWSLALERGAAGSVVVRVDDDGDGQPSATDAHADATSGRGLLLVAALSDAWGWHASADGGKVVWAEIGPTR